MRTVLLLALLMGAAQAQEIRARLNVTASSSESLTLMLRASAVGTHYALRVSSPVAENGGARARLTLLSQTGEGVAVLAETTAVWAQEQADIRFVSTADSRLLAYVNGRRWIAVHDSSIHSGQARWTNGLPFAAEISTGVDNTPPSNVTVAGAVYPKHVELQWTAATDFGSGVWAYEVLRDGAFVGRTAETAYSDGSAPPGQQLTYAVYGIDYFGNRSEAAVLAVETPRAATDSPKPVKTPITRPAAFASTAPAPAALTNAGEPRRVGVRSTGSYWGAGGEQIDTMSGNLNYTFPLLKAVGRGSWGVSFALSYNSQVWSQDASGPHLHGADVGYGFGWQFMAGALTPHWTGGVLDYHVFRDSTGAEHRLDRYAAGIWTSTEGIYVEYDEAAQRLYFPDGSFWTFGCVSAASEEDHGTRYPTLMQDTNGNQVIVRYRPGIGTGTPDTSARIQEIEDVRGKGSATFTFAYNADPIPHLTGVSCSLGSPYSGQWYQFAYAGYNLYSPLSGAFHHTTAILTGLTDSKTSLTNSFEYDTSSGELTRVILPYGGAIRWQYRTFALPAVTVREVQYRYLSKAAGAPEEAWTFLHDDTPYYPVHWWTVLAEPSGAGRAWFFYVDPASWGCGLTAVHEERLTPWDPAGARRFEYSWTQDAAGNPYPWRIDTLLEYLTASQVSTRTEQSLDTHGNVLQTSIYDYNSLSSPIRTYTHTYLATSPYTSRRIWNRLVSSSLTNGSQSVTLVTNTYDQGTLTNISGLYEHDPAYGVGFTYRGNVTRSEGSGKVVNYTYDIGGSVVSANDGSGHTVGVSQDASTNYSAPSVVTPNSAPSLASNYGYDASIRTSSSTVPGRGTTTGTYDGRGRPYQVNKADGSVDFYYYRGILTIVDTMLEGGWGSMKPRNRITTDGLGRTVMVEADYQSFWSFVCSVVDTEYGPAGGSPLGRVRRVSQPHAPGAPVFWTTYSYDAFGRTTRVDLPDGTGATTYVYQGSTTTVTDPAGKWKRYRVDALGNLVQVTEPAPEGGTHETYYTYNLRNQLIGVSMPRGGVTQTRTFNYDLNTGRLLSAANPENGAVSYTYNADGTLATKTDAKTQRTEYSYDQHQRTAQVRFYVSGVEQTCRRVDYTYTAALLTQVAWGATTCTPGRFTETFSYTSAGLPAGTTLTLQKSSGTHTRSVDFGYTGPFLRTIEYRGRKGAARGRRRQCLVRDPGRPLPVPV